jgi:hypothetical protein
MVVWWMKGLYDSWAVKGLKEKQWMDRKRWCFGQKTSVSLIKQLIALYMCVYMYVLAC